MTIPFLKSKLYVPVVRPELVSRTHLLKRLNAGIERSNGFVHKLTLISAPAGFGKTTLLSDWVVKREQAVAWISLDEGDNDPTRFLTYLVGALQSIENTFGQIVLSALQSSRTVNVEMVLTALLNEITTLPDEVILILDDYHLIESKSIDQAVSFILMHLPAQCHLVIATRSDPNIPLSRLRGRGQLNELRSADLRFTPEETKTFLKNILEVDIDQDHIDALNKRTEGWIAGLQMAAVSMRGVNDIPGFVSTFAGDHRYVVDYLVDEVLNQCSPEARDFLLQTSILKRLSAPLCNALTGRIDGQATLEKLEQDNLFTIPLDHRREWYRYHHLFAELLRHRLTQTNPDSLEKLHDRASRWLNENGFTHEAINQAMEMDDKHLAAGLLEYYTRILLFKGRNETKNMLEWFEQLPEDVIRNRPLLGVLYAWTRLFNRPFVNHRLIMNELDEIETLVNQPDMEASLKNIVIGHICSIRAFLSHPPLKVDHDPYSVLHLYHKALSLFPLSENHIRSSTYIGMAYEYMHLEDTDAAVQANDNALTEAQLADNHLVTFIAIRNQALIAYYLGEMDRAIQICRDGIELFYHDQTDKNLPLPGLEILFVTLGYLFTERGELDLAETEITKGYDLLQWFGEYESLVLGCISIVRLSLLRGGDDEALQVVKQFKDRWKSCRDLAELLRIQIGLTRIKEDPTELQLVKSWMQKERPGFENNTHFQGITPWAETRHLSHITWIQSQILLSQIELSSNTSFQHCLEYLDERIDSSRQQGLVFRVIECSVLKAQVLDAMGKREKALFTLKEAIVLAEPQGYQRVFLDKGPSMNRLLREITMEDIPEGYTHQLLDAISKRKVHIIKPPTQNLIEPLSTRELEVLQLIAQGFTNREIGNRLFLALNTVKGHNRNIFGKLGVTNRTQAVNKAQSLNIITPQDSEA